MDTVFLEIRNCKGDNLCFIERPRSFIHSSLVLVRGELDGEVGDLLPREYKFCRRGFPVSRKQEEGLQLNACIRTMQPNEVGAEQDTCDVSSDYCLEIKDFMIRDNTEATKVTPPRAGINRLPITGAVTSVTQTGIRESSENRGVEKSIVRIAEDKEALRYKLDIAQAKLVSLKEDIPEQAAIGSIRSVVCSRCHIRGHRVNKPCTLPPCGSYFDCGMLNLHKEHKAKIQEQETEVKELQKLTKKKEEEEEAFQLLKDRTRGNFFRVMRDRLKQCNPVKYSNRPSLDNDLRVLAAACKHIPPADGTDLCAVINGYKDTVHNKTGNTSVFNDSSPRYHPYRGVQIENQEFHPEKLPVPLMSQWNLHGGTPVSLRMGSPPNPPNNDWWHAFGGPYPRFADSFNSPSPRRGGSASSIPTVSPIRTFTGNSNRMSPYQENSWSHRNGSPVQRSQDNFHGMRPHQRQLPQWNGPHYTDRNLRPKNSHSDQHSPRSSGYHYYHSPKSTNPRRGLNYSTKLLPKGSKGLGWRKTLPVVNLGRQQPLEKELLNTTSQPDPLAPLATSTPVDEESDVNVEDSDSVHVIADSDPDLVDATN